MIKVCLVTPEEKAMLTTGRDTTPEQPVSPPSATAEQVYCRDILEDVETALEELRCLEDSLIYIENQETIRNRKQRNYSPWFQLYADLNPGSVMRSGEARAVILDDVKDRLRELREDLLRRLGEE